MEYLSDNIIASAIVTLTVISVFRLSSRRETWIKKLLDWMPAILFAYLIPALFTHSFSLDMSNVLLHDFSRSLIIPLTILLVMSALSFRQLRIVGIRPIVLFVSGSFIIAILPVALVWMLNAANPDYGELFFGGEFWKGLVPIVGGWIGGSTSQLVLKELVGCPEGLFLAVLVLDNILVNIWTILMFQMIRRSDQFNKYLNIRDTIPDFVPDEVQLDARKAKYAIMTLCIPIVILIPVLIFISSFLWQVVIFSLIGLILGNFIPKWNHALVLKIGGVLIVVIMAILGLKLNFSNFSLPGIVVMVAVIWILSHYLFMMLIARLLKLHMAWVPIASMANLGGISTAPAVTAAYNEEWMPHAILLAILSMVTGTGWGMVTIFLFQLY